MVISYTPPPVNQKYSLTKNSFNPNKEDIKNPWNIAAPKSGRVKMMSELIDSSVMPGIQGGPLMHVIAGKAVAFEEALNQDFIIYCKKC